MTENLVTVVSRETWLKINLLLLGHATTPVRWLGLVARRQRLMASRAPFDQAAEFVGRVKNLVPRRTNVRIVSSVPRGLSGPHYGLSEAEWGRALVEWALEKKLGPVELDGIEQVAMSGVR